MEIDGNDVDGRTPNSHGIVYNLTFIGNSSLGSGGKGNVAIEAKAETEGEIYNSIFANYAQAGLRVKSGLTQTNYTNGLLKVNCNTFVNVPDAVRVLPTSNQAKFDADGNVVVASLTGFDPAWEFSGTDCSSGITFTGKVDQVPDNKDQIGVTNACPKSPDGFFDYAPYRGAFEPGVEPWTKGWSYYSSVRAGSADVLCPTDLNGDGTTNTTDYLQVVGQFGRSCQ
jgi:hypothetical protein